MFVISGKASEVGNFATAWRNLFRKRFLDLRHFRFARPLLFCFHFSYAFLQIQQFFSCEIMFGLYIVLRVSDVFIAA